MQLNTQFQKKTKQQGGGIAFTLLIAYFFFEYVRPQDSISSIIGYFKIPMLLTVALLVVVLKADKQPLKDPRIVLIGLFIGFLALSVPFSANNFVAFQVTKNMVLGYIAICAMVVSLNTEDVLKKFVDSWIVISAIVAIIVVINGGKGPGGFLGDENDAALVMDMALPFPWYMSQRPGITKKRKFFYFGCCILITFAMMTTASRGGLVGFAAVIGVMLLLSAKPVKNIFTALVFTVFMGGGAISLLPQDYVEDMKTISDTEGGTAGLRWLHWTTATIMFSEHPILGVGAGNYPWNSQNYLHRSSYFKEGARDRSGRQTHSLYFTLIPETGLVGIIIFLSMLKICYTQGQRIRRAGAKNSKDIASPFMKLAATALLCAFVGYLGAGAFISVLYYPVFWHLVALSTAFSLVFINTQNSQTIHTRQWN